MSFNVSSAMPPQVKPEYPLGASSIMTAGIVNQNNQAARQNALIGTGGSKKKYRTIRGGAVATNASPVVQVPSVPSGSVSPEATGANYTEITKLAQQQVGDALYDNAKTPVETALLQQQQQQQYKGLGGRKRRKSRKGRKSRKSRKSRKGRKSRKSRKSKNP